MTNPPHHPCALSSIRPSAQAQARLIRACYQRAGLDAGNRRDRPQYFEAHGTGTPTGDPLEAEAISAAFFGGGADHLDGADGPLYVGSVKTVVGHTEGTAGLAGLLKAMLAIRHSTIPPNLLFDTLNPRIEPFYHHLHVPTACIPWPRLPTGVPMRASVNSFGFGGSNAHVILESYPRPEQAQHLSVSSPTSNKAPFCPFIFSAASESSLSRSLASWRDYLVAHDTSTLDLRSLAYTLHSRRTRFPIAAALVPSDTTQLVSRIDHVLSNNAQGPLGVRALQGSSSSSDAPSRPRILGIFTGQGAQWARMGIDIITHSANARSVIDALQAALDGLPASDRPSWSLLEELQKPSSLSRLGEAALSQPLCTAIQILLVDILRAAGVQLCGAVGHSSGEIAAAYAAGVISAEHAICIAYYRGLYAKLAHWGAMMAVGTSLQDVEQLLREPEYQGRVCVAAVNSGSSGTLSGDRETLAELGALFKDEGKFARMLKVNTAYHSKNMLPCSEPYLDALTRLTIHVSTASHCAWYSSVCDESTADMAEALRGPHWDRNMLGTVRFMQAMEKAVNHSSQNQPPFALALEIGPHPALKSPAMENIEDAAGLTIPYASLLQRDANDVEALAAGFGRIATCLGRDSVDFRSYDEFMMGKANLRPCQGLPTYAWNHDREFWHESRYARAVRLRADSVHELLGHQTPDSTDTEMRWRHLLRPREIAWLSGHQLQN